MPRVEGVVRRSDGVAVARKVERGVEAGRIGNRQGA